MPDPLRPHRRAFKSTVWFAKWRVFKRLGYDPWRIHSGVGLCRYYRDSLAVFKKGEGASHNACVEFRLGDGRILTVWDGDNERARAWTLSHKSKERWTS